MFNKELFHLSAIIQFKEGTHSPHESKHKQTAQMGGTQNAMLFFTWDKTLKKVKALKLKRGQKNIRIGGRVVEYLNVYYVFNVFKLYRI